jgi:hypothetical protein
MCCKGETTEHCTDNQKLMENRRRKNLNINLFMKRIKDDQTRCLDIQTGSKVDGLQKYFSNILQHTTKIQADNHNKW